MGSNEEGGSKLSLLDRSVSVVLKNAERTASGRDGISPRTERLHRLHGTSLILDASRLLALGTSTFATACSIFHRFFQQVSLKQYDVWSIALASTLLSTKVEEEPRSVSRIVHTFCYMFRKRILLLASLGEEKGWKKDHPSMGSLRPQQMSPQQVESFVTETALPQALNIPGSVYSEWFQRAISSEATILRQLGFTLYWIPDSHPHRFVLSFCEALGLSQPQYIECAWNYCNDGCRLDISLRYPAEEIAATCIILAARDFAINLPMLPQPWWETFVGKTFSKEIAMVANAILGLSSPDMNEEAEILGDSLLASGGYVISCLGGEGSFTDPEGFLFHEAGEAIRKFLSQ